MNIAMIQSTPYPPEEGIGNYVDNLSRELITRGHSVTVVTRGGFQTEKFLDDQLRIVRLPCPPIYPFHVDVHGVIMNKYLNRRQGQFDLVHTHTPLTPVIENSLPLVSTIHTSIVEDVKYVESWSVTKAVSRLMLLVSSKRLVAGQSKVANRVTTTSEPVKKELLDHYGIDNATILGNGVDADQFRPNDTRSSEDYVLYVGRLDHPKGLPELLDVANQIIDTHDIEFKIVGKGPLRDELEQRVAQLGIDANVTFPGYVSRDRQIRLYQDATAFVLPSLYEGLPTVLLEAMACGAPVIATRVGGCPEVIDDGENGLLVPPGDSSSLFDALDRLLCDAEMRTEFSSSARQTIRDRYTWDEITDQFEREYQLAMEAR